MPAEYLKLSAPALSALPRDKTVFIFPVGPLEPHGPHLPIGLDLMEAQKVCEGIGNAVETRLPGWKAVIMPAVPLGIDSNTAGSLRIVVRAHVLRDWLVDACRCLNKEGFRFFTCYSGHEGPRQITAIEEVARLIRSPRHWLNRSTKPVFVSASSLLVDKNAALRSPMVIEPDEHAGERDTSIGLHAAPSEVSQVYVGLPEQEKGGAGLAWRLQQRMSGTTSQYWGAPGRATSENGSKITNERVEKIMAELVPVLTGSKPNKFKSVYRFFPPNRSFFKAWLIFTATLMMMLGWTAVYISGLMAQ